METLFSSGIGAFCVGVMDSPEMGVFIISSLVKIGLVIGVVLGMVSYTVMAERRVSAAIQDRVGPNRVGIPWTKIRLFGLGQPLVDSVKLMLKEDFTPAHVNKFYFWLAPALGVIPALITVCVVPFASIHDITIPLNGWISSFSNITIPKPGVIADIDIGILFTFAIASLGVYGIVLAGWSSNSKYPFLGGIRSSAQMISYEIAMGLSVIPIFMVIGHLNLSDIIHYQAEEGWTVFPVMAHRVDLKKFLDWWGQAKFDGGGDFLVALLNAPGINLKSFLLLPCMLVSFLIFMVASFAETNRAPFDFPESETELVGGFNTEYSSMKFALFFLGEYAALIVASAMMVTLFFGGWTLPFGWLDGWVACPASRWFSGDGHPWWFVGAQAAVFFVKVVCFIFFFIWVRWTVPRFRYDQLMRLGWNVFLPMALLNVAATGLILAAFEHWKA